MDGFLNPFVDYLRATLPPPLYSFILNVVSNALVAINALVNLSASLLNSSPTEWRAETILPPLITILAAYLALASLYRTASWAIRLMFFFLKWGTLIGIMMAIAGYFAGSGTNMAFNQDGGGILAVAFTSVFGRGTSSKHNRQMKPRRKNKPKSWNSHQVQHQEGAEVIRANPHAQQIMNSIVNAAERAIGSSWWSAALNLGQSEASTEETRGEGKTGKTRSR